MHCDAGQPAKQAKIKQVALIRHREHLGGERRGQHHLVHGGKHREQQPDHVDFQRRCGRGPLVGGRGLGQEREGDEKVVAHKGPPCGGGACGSLEDNKNYTSCNY